MSKQSKLVKTILDKQFKAITFNGYDPLEVDTFLDEVIFRIKELEDDISIIKQQNSQLDNENNILKNKLKVLEKEGYSQNKK